MPTVRGRVESVFIVFVLSLSCVSLSFGGELCETSEECLLHIEEEGGQTRVFSGSFKMEKYVTLLQEPIVSEGAFAFRSPNQAYWLLPETQTLLAVKGDQLSFFGADQAVLPPSTESGGEMASLGTSAELLMNIFVGRMTPLRETFSIEAQVESATVRLQLSPKSEEWSKVLSRIEVDVDYVTALVQRLRIYEAVGDSIDLRFTNLHRNDLMAEKSVADMERRKLR